MNTPGNQIQTVGAAPLATGAVPPPPERRWVRRASLALALVLLVWAATAPLQEGVPANASVVVDTKRKPVQHQFGGIVTELLVREGSVVREGDVLLRLDSVSAQAQTAAVRQRYLSLRAIESRLLAERDGRNVMAKHEDLAEALADPVVRVQWETQQQLLRSRVAAQASALAGLRESRLSQEASIASSKAMLVNRQRQLAILREQLQGLEGLVADGFAPRNRKLDIERQVAETTTAIEGLTGSIATAERAIAEIDQRIAQRRSEYARDIGDQLTAVYRDVSAEAQRLQALQNEEGRTELRAPASGQVVGLVVPGPGTVVQAAQKLAEIVPEGEPLLLEAQVPPRVIDRVRKGQSVDVRFSNFVNAPDLKVLGTVDTISADTLPDPITRQPFYLARVVVTREGVKELGANRLQPGMQAQVIFQTGERSLLKYWLHPLLRRISLSLTEH